MTPSIIPENMIIHGCKSNPLRLRRSEIWAFEKFEKDKQFFMLIFHVNKESKLKLILLC